MKVPVFRSARAALVPEIGFCTLPLIVIQIYFTAFAISSLAARVGTAVWNVRKKGPSEKSRKLVNFQEALGSEYRLKDEKSS